MHVGLDRHEQGRVEALGLAILRIEGDLFGRCPPRQSPHRVGAQEPRRAVRMNQIPPATRDTPEAVPRENRRRCLGYRCRHELTAMSVQPRVTVPINALPTSRPAVFRRSEPHTKDPASVPEHRTAQHRPIVMNEFHPGFDVGVGIRRR